MQLVFHVTIPIRCVEGCWQVLSCIVSHFLIKDIISSGVLSISFVKWCSLLMLVPCNTKSGAAVDDKGS